MSKIILNDNGKPIKIGSGVLSNGIDMLTKLVSDTFSDTDKPDFSSTQITKLQDGLFYNKKSLKKMPVLPSTCNELGERCFYNCSNLQIEIPESITKFGNTCFSAAGDLNHLIDLDLKNITQMGGNAFNQASIRKITGTLNCTIGANAFCGNSTQKNERNTVKEVDLTVIVPSSYTFSGDYGLGYLYNVDKFKLTVKSKEGATSGYFGGRYIMARLSMGRNTHSNEFFEIDFSDFKATSCPAYMLQGGGSNDEHWIKNFNLYMPKTITAIDNYICQYCAYYNIFLYGSSMIPLNSSSYITYNPYHIFVPYTLISTYKAGTNWSRMANYIFGWIPEADSTTLPADDGSGHNLIWYSDYKMTQVVTEAEIGSRYYCKFA